MQIRALVVDNDPVLLKLIATLLTRENCVVKTAVNGLHALEILENYSPDIIFTDLIMPQVNGEQLCKILRRTGNHKNTFIVVLSAIILEDRDRIKDIDCDLCIAKGNLKEIRSCLLEALVTFNAQKRSVISTSSKSVKIPAGLTPSVVTSELLSEKNHLTKILENLNEGIIDLNERGMVLDANRAALEFLNSREENIIGRSISALCDWGEFQGGVTNWNTRQVIGRGFAPFEIFEQNPMELNGRLLTASFIPVADKDTVFAICIIRDITRQYRAEENSRELDNAVKLIKKMDAMSCMAGGVAHDFNNLLTVICGNIDIIVSKGEKCERDEIKKLIEHAKQAALAAVDLTRKISGFSNFGIVSREQVDIEKLLTDAVARFFNSKTDRYHIESKTKDCLVHIDLDEFSSALENILQNAVDADENGAVNISLDCDEFEIRQIVHGQYVPAGRYVRVDIQDGGKGIKKEHLLRVFDPYYSTKERGFEKGIGLGMTAVYSTLRNHGGYVVIDSEEGCWTKVSLYIPAYKKLFGRSVSHIESPLTGQKILLIEPDKEMGQIAEIMVKHLGLVGLVTPTRAGALTALREMKNDISEGEELLVLLDLSEKQGGSAEETCRLLHDVWQDLKVIAMSSNLLDPIMADSKKFGFAATLPKPYTIDSLRHILAASLCE